MKVFKRILATMMCLCLVWSCVAVIGTAAETGSITIENQSGTNATVAGKTLNLFKIFEATTDGENISYQWVKDGTTNRYETFFFGGPGKNGVTHERLLPESASTIHDVVAYINELKDDSFAFSQMAAKLHNYIHAEDINPTETSGVIDSGAISYTFENLALGYYLIYDATTIGDGEAAVRSAAMLTHPGENKTIKLKADRPHIEKYVDDNDTDAEEWKLGTTASIGDTVSFRIVTMIPDHDLYGDNYTFEITDIMDDTLELDAASISVTETKPTSSTAEEAKYDIITDKNDLDDAKQDFQIIFKNVSKLDKDTLIEITYDAKVLSTALPKNDNKVTLTYSNDPNSTTGSEGNVSAKASVMLWQFTLTKHMEDASGTPSFIRLAGAEFEIYSVNDLNNPLKFTTEEKTEQGVTYLKYTYDPSASAGTVTTLKTQDEGDDGKENVGYTDGGYLGQILIWGLGEGTYVIRETKAPDGYQIAKGDFKFTLTDTIGTTGAISNAEVNTDRNEKIGQFTRVMVDETNQKYYVGITNAPGAALPETGGMGTTLFTVIGIVLMAGALGFFSTRKRNSMA